MKIASCLASVALPAAVLAATAFESFNPLLRYRKLASKARSREEPHFAKRQTGSSPFLNSNTTQFLVNGTGIPNVDFDVGESFAGSLPIGPANDGSSLFFWFFPISSDESPKEIVIWMNGGPGCSSMNGLLQENGPFLWQRGTDRPFDNPWSWHHLTNVVWVEHPVGTGFATGTVTATNEDDVAQQFMGFWKNFVDVFGMQGYSVYLTGESYAGLYCPYISSNMLDANDTTYYNVKGMWIIDPVVAGGTAGIAPTKHFLQYWQGHFPLNDTTRTRIENFSQSCGYDAYTDQYLTFPPSGQQPGVCQTPGINDNCTEYIEECQIYDLAYYAINELNPAFDIYQIAQLTPLPYDPISFSDALPGTQPYFNRTDVKQAIHAPENVDWMVCSLEVPFVNKTDDSDPSSYRVLPNVIDRTQNVQISHGTLDMILLANGTLLAIQNMTWGGQMGFQTKPSSPLFVPHHPNPHVAGSSGQGVQGTWHEERGLTWSLVGLTGHMIPQWQAAVAFRQLQVLLGRVDSLADTTAFPQYADAVQPDVSELGFGTGPP